MNVVKSDKYDRRHFRDIVFSSDRLMNIERQGTDELPTFPPLMQDVFTTLYKPRPQMVPEKDIPRELLLNKDLITQAQELREFKDMKPFTMLDEVTSAIGTISIAEKIIDLIPEEQAEKIKRIIFLHDEALEKVENGESIDDIAIEIRSLRSEITPVDEDELRLALRRALTEAKEDVQEYSDMMAGWGIGGGAIQSMDFASSMHWFHRLKDSEKLQKIAKMVGRFKNAAVSRQISKVQHCPDEISEIELGDNIERMLPSELVKITHPLLRLLFFKDYLERALMQYKIKPFQKKDQGPIIIAIDSSRSMNGAREEWAKAFALGLTVIAQKQKRAVYGIIFGSGEHQIYCDNLNEGFMETVRFLERKFGGGTDFNAPLNKAIEVLKGEKTYHDADIIFITDGLAQLLPETIAELNQMKKSGVRMFAILILSGAGALDQVADRIIKIDNLFLDEEALNIYGEL